jgi:hypothetical protein
MRKLNIGDIVFWSGAWGMDPIKRVKVTSIEVDCVNKQGRGVDSVPWLDVQNGGRTTMVILDNDHWAYGNQIQPI